MVPCDSVSTSATSTRSHGRISTRSHSSPISSTNWAAQQSTPSLTSMLATIMFTLLWATSGRQPSERIVLYHLSSGQICHALGQDPSHSDDDVTVYAAKTSVTH